MLSNILYFYVHMPTCKDEFRLQLDCDKIQHTVDLHKLKP